MPADVVARARALRPLLEAAAPRIEQARALTPEVLEALHEAQLFRLALPRSVGGLEADLPTIVQAIEAVAQGDASAAWCLGQAAGCALAAAHLEPAAAREIFGPREAVLAWGAGAQGRAIPVEGGFRVTGSWMFASGSRHATWIGGHCNVVEPDGGVRPHPRTMLFPRASARIVDNWRVIGLRGTGSDSYSVEDLFVPAEHAFERDTGRERREPGPLYLFATSGVYAPCFAAVALGIARSLLDDLIRMAHAKTPRGLGKTMRESESTQMLLGQAEAKLGAARAFLLRAVDEAWGAAERGDLTLDRRVGVRLAATHAIVQATEVSEFAYKAAGASAVFDDAPFERRFRDAHAVSQQLQGRLNHFETVGRYLLGLEIDTTFL